MNQKNQQALIDLYDSFYNKKIKFLLAIVESRYQKFPPPFLNEIRSAFDHIARCYQQSKKNTDKSIEKEIDSARRHLERIILDCYKYLIIFFDDSYKEFDKKNKNVDFKIIDDGKFYQEYKAKVQKAIETTRKAKDRESFDKTESFSLYQEAFNYYYELDNFIYSNIVKVSKAKLKLRIFSFFSFLVWLISLILTSILGAILSCNLLNWIFKLIKLIF